MARSIGDYYDLTVNTAARMTTARANVKWSSGIFNNAQKKNNELRDKLDFYKKADKELTSAEIADLRRSAEEARDAFEQYDDRYKKKKNPAANTQARGSIVADGLKFIDELLSDLDAKEKALETKEVASPKDMGVETLKMNDELKDGAQDVKLGSKVYKDTMNAMRRYQEILEKHSNQDGVVDKNSFTTQELDEMTGLLHKAERGATEYLRVKEDKDLGKNPKMAKRNHTMGNVKDLAATHLKKLDAIKDSLEKTPAKDLEELFTGAQDAFNDIEVATKGVHNGSSEYDEAQKEFKHVRDLLKETQDVGDYEFNSYQRRLFSANLDVAESKIDKYLAKKADKEKLDDKEQRRVDAMRKAKNTILETRKRLNEEIKKDRADAISAGQEALDDYLTQASDSLEKGSRALRFSSVNGGSEEYKNGKKAFNEAVQDAKNIFKDDKYKNMTMEERQKAIDKLRDQRKTVESYIIKKHSKDGLKDRDLNENGTIRMKAMYDAHAGITFMLDKLQAYQEAERDKERKYDKADFNKKIDERLATYSNEGKNGLDRTRNNASKEAVKALAKYGKSDRLTANEIKGAKYAMAALLLDERISALKPDERKKYPRSPKEYAKFVKNLAESKEFAKKFPDSSITPSKLRKLATDPKECRKSMRSLFGEVTKVNNYEKQRLKPKEIQNPEQQHLPGK
jgi:hypothetical protein